MLFKYGAVALARSRIAREKVLRRSCVVSKRHTYRYWTGTDFYR